MPSALLQTDLSLALRSLYESCPAMDEIRLRFLPTLPTPWWSHEDFFLLTRMHPFGIGGVMLLHDLLSMLLSERHRGVRTEWRLLFAGRLRELVRRRPAVASFLRVGA